MTPAVSLAHPAEIFVRLMLQTPRNFLGAPPRCMGIAPSCRVCETLRFRTDYPTGRNDQTRTMLRPATSP